MKITIVFFFCLLGKIVIAQDANRLFKVNNQYIFADTNGNIPLAKRFDKPVSVLRDKYIVSSNGVYGVVEKGKYIYPCEYSDVKVLYVANFHVFILSTSNGKALGTRGGKILTDFDYQGIKEYVLINSSREKIYYDKGSFFQFEVNGKLRLGFLNDNGKFTLLNDPVDGIKDSHGLFALQKGKGMALYEFDQKGDSLKTILPFSENQLIKLSSDYYAVLDSKNNQTKAYSYDHTLLNTLEGIYHNIPEEYRYQEDEGVHPEPGRDGSREGSKLPQKELDRPIQAFFHQPVLYSTQRDVNYYAKMAITGTKGQWQVHSDFTPSRMGDFGLHDTTFSIKVDELVRKTDLSSSFLITRTGKNFGAVDNLGNEIFPPQFKQLDYQRGKDNAEWLIVREESKSLLIYYNPSRKSADTVWTGEAKDEYQMEGNSILVKRPVSVDKTQMKLVNFTDMPSQSRKQVKESSEFYDLIVQYTTFPYFFKCYRNGKEGVLSKTGSLLVPCEHDSIQLKAHYFTSVSKYGTPNYVAMQPVFSTYSGGKKYLAYPTKDENAATIVLSSPNHPFRFSAQVSDDGLFVVDPVGNGRMEIYALDGKKLSKEPIILSEENRRFASFVDGYWYLAGKDSKGGDVLIGQNGAWFELPK